MKGLLNKIKHASWQFKTADLSLSEILLVFANKIIAFFTKLGWQAKGFLLAGDANIVLGVKEDLPKNKFQNER